MTKQGRLLLSGALDGYNRVVGPGTVSGKATRPTQIATAPPIIPLSILGEKTKPQPYEKKHFLAEHFGGGMGSDRFFSFKSGWLLAG